MAASKNMTLREWNEFCNERGLDPSTGGKSGVVFVHVLDEPGIRERFDEWAENQRAHERQWAETHRPQPKPKWRLRWVKV
jgi:hypothetical protein